MSKTLRIALCIVGVVVLVLAIGISQYSYIIFAQATGLSFDYSPHESTPLSWAVYSQEYLRNLRLEFELDKLVEDCGSDYERVKVVTNWVHNLWKHDGMNEPMQSDPLFILREVAEGQRFRCVEYGIVISGCLQALGIDARTLGLKTKDVESRASGAGHVATEAYLPDLAKWVFIDGQWNAIPEAQGVPLNAVELQAALATKDPTLKFAALSATDSLVYKKWITPYLYYFDVWAEDQRIMLGPVGAKQPTVFQRGWPLSVSLYTHSVEVLYAPPK